MLNIHSYQQFLMIKEIDKVILLIQAQMQHIKAEKSVDDIKRALRTALVDGKRACLIVCYEDEDPVGFIFGNICSGIESGGDYFWMNEIHVRKDQRRQEIARKMMNYLENWLKEHKIKRILGITGKKNEVAQKIFIKLGFDENDVVWIDKYLS